MAQIDAKVIRELKIKENDDSYETAVFGVDAEQVSYGTSNVANQFDDISQKFNEINNNIIQKFNNTEWRLFKSFTPYTSGKPWCTEDFRVDIYTNGTMLYFKQSGGVGSGYDNDPSSLDDKNWRANNILSDDDGGAGDKGQKVGDFTLQELRDNLNKQNIALPSGHHYFPLIGYRAAQGNIRNAGSTSITVKDNTTHNFVTTSSSGNKVPVDVYLGYTSIVFRSVSDGNNGKKYIIRYQSTVTYPTNITGFIPLITTS